ncbi:MAG: prepilin-type N-terminal cleavage/methylation domain-containing protein [Rhodoferax sp.]
MNTACFPIIAGIRAGAARRSTPQCGFTLLELLVVMSLLSIIMIGLVSALRSMAQTESRIDQRLQRLDEIRVAHVFLRQTLSRASAMTVDEPGATGKRIIPFVATPESLSWIGIMPARPNIGGRHFFRLSIEENGTGQELVLRFLPWNPDVVLPDWSTAEFRVLVSGIRKMTVQAQGIAPQNQNAAQAWPAGWQNGWPIIDALPEQIRLGLTDDQGDWPEWTISLHALPQGDNSFRSTVIGGSAQ